MRQDHRMKRTHLRIENSSAQVCSMDFIKSSNLGRKVIFKCYLEGIAVKFYNIGR